MSSGYDYRVNLMTTAALEIIEVPLDGLTSAELTKRLADLIHVNELVLNAMTALDNAGDYSSYIRMNEIRRFVGYHRSATSLKADAVRTTAKWAAAWS